jgi:hypothetical protein
VFNNVHLYKNQIQQQTQRGKALHWDSVAELVSALFVDLGVQSSNFGVAIYSMFRLVWKLDQI